MAENIAILHSPITLVYNTDLRQKMTGNGGHFVTAYSHEWVSLGAIKKFSAWPSSVQNKVKIVFYSYSSKAQNTTRRHAQ